MQSVRLSVIASLALCAVSAVGNAQAAGGVVSRASAAPVATHREIPAVAARALVAAHHPDVIDGSADGALVTIVLDADNNYVASSVSKPSAVLRAADGSVSAAVGGFAGAAVAKATVAPAASGSTAEPTARPVVSIAGIGQIEGNGIDEMFTTTYAAGEVAPTAVRIRYVILKR